MHTPCDVVVIGSSNMDMVVRCGELPLPGDVHHEVLVRGEHDQVGVRPDLDPALVGEPHPVGRRRGHPPDHVDERDTAGPGRRPDDGQRHLQRRDAMSDSPLSS